MRKTALGWLFVLVGCGGGGGGGSTPPTLASPEGLWLGSTNTSRTITGLVLDSGAYYFLYSAPANATVIAGFVQGSGATVNSSATFSSSDTRDFNLEGNGLLTATVQGTFAQRQTLNGTVNYGIFGTTTLATTFSTDYDKAPSLTTIAGTYTGQTALSTLTPIVENATVTVTTGGTFTGSTSGGCNFSGIIAPHPKGNAYDVTLTFGASPCTNAGQVFAGIGYYDELAKRLYAAAPNAPRTLGALFVGTKP